MRPSSAATPDLTPERLHDICAEAWDELFGRPAEQPSLPACDAAWIGRAAQILAANLSAGRLEAARFYHGEATSESALLAGYARQVIRNLLCEEDRLALLIAGETAAWQPVIERLERLAFFWLRPHGRQEWTAWEAREVAADTCADLWLWLQMHTYPFDVPFDRWATRALINRLQGRARQRRRAPPILALDDEDMRHVPEGTNGLEMLLLREALDEALNRLPVRQATVIRLWHLEGWRADEIAGYLKTRIGNVYVLRCRGLQALRQNRLLALGSG